MYDGYSLQDALMRHAHAKQGINRVPFMPGVPGLSSWDGFNPLAPGSAAAHRPFHVQRFLKQAAAAQQQLQRHMVENTQLKSPPRSSSFADIPTLPAPFRPGLSIDLDTPNGKKRRGNYASYTPQQRIEIGAFSIEYGTGKASKQFALPESTARGFRDKLMKILQDGSEKLPLEADRIARLRVLLETNSSLPGGSVSSSSPTLQDSGLLKTPSFPPVPNQLFRPHLDFADNNKLNESNASIKIEDFSSDADSGHSSANSSNSELKKSPTQTAPTTDMRFLLDKLQTYTRFRNEAMENFGSVIPPSASLAGQKRTHEVEAERDQITKRARLTSQTIAQSSPDEKKAIRRALYAENTAPNPSGGGTDLDASVQIDSHFGMSARTAAKMVVTHAPSDISSIQGDLTDLTERDCQTPNSDISVEAPEQNTADVEINPAQQNGNSACATGSVELGDSEASNLLGQIEESLDKVTGAVTQRPASFTARLLATQTQLVKFVADCEMKILDESKERMKLAMEVDQMKKTQIKQAQLIDALTKELMATSSKLEALEDSSKSKPNDPVGNTVGDLINLLKKPENMAKMEDQKKTLPKMTTLNVDDCDIAALVDAIGDQMSKK